MVDLHGKSSGPGSGTTAQNAKVERLLAEGWLICKNWDLRPWGGAVVLKKENLYVGVDLRGIQQTLEEKELPRDWDANSLRRQEFFDRLLRPYRNARQWLGAFGCGWVWTDNPMDFRFSGFNGGVAFGRWVCLGQPEVDDAHWLRIGKLWVSWPIWWTPWSLKRARRRFHGAD